MNEGFKKYVPLVGMGAKAVSAAWDAIKDDFYEWMDHVSAEVNDPNKDPQYQEYLRKQRAELVEGSPGGSVKVDDGLSSPVSSDPKDFVL
jgi:hypothetical protein